MLPDLFGCSRTRTTGLECAPLVVQRSRLSCDLSVGLAALLRGLKLFCVFVAGFLSCARAGKFFIAFDVEISCPASRIFFAKNWVIGRFFFCGIAREISYKIWGLFGAAGIFAKK